MNTTQLGACTQGKGSLSDSCYYSYYFKDNPPFISCWNDAQVSELASLCQAPLQTIRHSEAKKCCKSLDRGEFTEVTNAIPCEAPGKQPAALPQVAHAVSSSGPACSTPPPTEPVTADG